MNTYQILLKLANAMGVSAYLRQWKTDKLTVLCLHRISIDADFFWQPINPRSFDRLLQYAKKHYQIILFRDLTNLSLTERQRKPLLVLSFDDGYYDFIEYAMPILHKHQISANHNLVNECLTSNKIIWTQRLNFIFNYLRSSSLSDFILLNDRTYTLPEFSNNWIKFYIFIFKKMLSLNSKLRDNILSVNEKNLDKRCEVKMLDWNDAQYLVSNGIEIGCHTYSHDVLSTITDKEVLRFETVGAKNELEKRLSISIDILSLPNGQASLNDLKYYFQNFKFVLQVDDGCTLLNSIEGSEKLISRINLVNEDPKLMYLRTELFFSKAKSFIYGRL